MKDGYEDDGRLAYLVGSLIVNPNCTFYGYPEYYFQGNVSEFTEGELERRCELEHTTFEQPHETCLETKFRANEA